MKDYHFKINWKLKFDGKLDDKLKKITQKIE